MKLIPNNLTDLYHLSKVIEPGDSVSSFTTRKIKLGGDEEKSRSVRKPANITVTVLQVKMDHVSEVLRVSGNIMRAPEDMPLGSAHTLSIEPNDELTIRKSGWKQYQLDRIRKAEKAAYQPRLLVMAFDDEEACFAILSDSGVRYIGTESLYLAKKSDMKGHERVKDSIGELANLLEKMHKEHAEAMIIIASPAFWKDELMKVLKNKHADIAKNAITETVNSGGEAGVKELLNKGVLSKLAKQSQLTEEFSLVEEIKKRVHTGGSVAYGLEPVLSSANADAISDLALTEKFLERERSQGTYEEIDELINTVEKGQGRVVIISSDHDAGSILDGLSGVAALLRFRVS